MRDASKTMPIDISGVLQLNDVLSDFSIAEAALAKHSSVILADSGSWKYALMTMSEYEKYLKAINVEEEELKKGKLQDLINGAGKKFFIENYMKFKSDSIDQDDLLKDSRWSSVSLKPRISRARSIFKNNWQIEALKHIVKSSEKDAVIQKLAWDLLSTETKSDEFRPLRDFSNIKIQYNDSHFFNSNDEYDKLPLEELNNKRFAFKCIELLQENDALDNETINILTDKDLCREKFCCSGFPILSEVSFDGELTDEDCTQNGRQRFYKSKIIIGNRAFVLSNHWYGPSQSMPDNRTPFQAWVMEKIGQGQSESIQFR